eukprot:TRINITY_DN6166_c0_g2_i2.p1 TRINITY_DN6166_c0_g2~~TRINITY_DN6166_c0_g2_i2.p1  ORF type:complete len:579 (-),score=141.42 TRINITY_DN6166_c0_g2_i2:49-1689(-)
MEAPARATFTTLSLCYLLVSVGLLALLAVGLQYWRRDRKRTPGDGLLVLSGWHPALREVISFGLLVFLLLPSFLFAGGFLLGWILALAEGWSFTEGFEYVICNMCAIGPMVNLTPDTNLGLICDIAVSVLALLVTSTTLGLAASFGMATEAIHSTPQGFLGFLRTLFIYVPIVLLTLSSGTGALLAGIDGWAASDGILFMIGALCGIQDPLTAASPASDPAFFFTAICTVVELCVGGVVIGIVGAHPAIAKFVVLVEGKRSRAAVASSAAASKVAHKAEPPDRLSPPCADLLDMLIADAELQRVAPAKHLGKVKACTKAEKEEKASEPSPDRAPARFGFQRSGSLSYVAARNRSRRRRMLEKAFAAWKGTWKQDSASELTVSERPTDKSSKSAGEIEQIPLAAHKEAMTRLQDEHSEKVDTLQQELDLKNDQMMHLRHLLAAAQASDMKSREKLQEAQQAAQSKVMVQAQKAGLEEEVHKLAAENDALKREKSRLSGLIELHVRREREGGATPSGQHIFSLGDMFECGRRSNHTASPSSLPELTRK